MPDHDNSQKLLFSHREMVRDLVTGYIPGAWLADVDFETLERKFASYVSPDLRERLDDVVWRVRWKGSHWLYVYLLLEFQSTVDPIMAIRIMVYEGLLYQDLFNAGEAKPGEFPPVLAIVLYNGVNPWTAPLDVDGLLAGSPPGLEPARPQARYMMLDAQRTAGHGPETRRNLVAALFALEKSRTREDIVRVLDSFVEWFTDPALAGLSADLLTWLKRVLLPARVPNVEIPEVNSVQEMRTMLAERVQEWVAPWTDEARKEGEQKGEQKGEALMLLDLLDVRFGPLRGEDRQRVERADSETLRRWARKVLTADRVESVLE